MMGVICRQTGKAIAAKLEGHYCLCKNESECPVLMPDATPKQHDATAKPTYENVCESLAQMTAECERWIKRNKTLEVKLEQIRRIIGP